MWTRIVLLCLNFALLITSSSLAQERNWYGRVEGGISLFGTKQVTGSVLDMEVDFKEGATFGGVIGYDFGNYRIETDIGKHIHKVDRFNVVNDGGLGLGGAGSLNAVTGKSNHTRFMANIVYDLQSFSVRENAEPFIGTGIGISKINWNNMATLSAEFAHSADTAFSFQIFGGLRYPIAKHVEASVKYRYFKSIDVDMVDRLNNSFDTTYETHDFIVGLLFRFGFESTPVRTAVPFTPGPETVPVQEVSPAPQTEQMPVIAMRDPYRVYFDWDSTVIDETGQGIVVSAANDAKNGENVTIEVEGHADRSGPEDYNEDLSLRRAVAVKNALITEGIAESLILIEAFGERRPEVETADGVRERRNRRVIITVSNIEE